MKYYKERKYIILMCILILVIIGAIVCLVQFQFLSKIAQTKFGNQMEQTAIKNKSPIFKIKQIVLYSSAHAIDYSQEQNLQDVAISQYTDIAMYIDNTKTSEEITGENTISELYIDNIKLNVKSNLGTPTIGYKNTLNIGKYRDIETEGIPERIDFQIIYNNKESQENDYSMPTFYTDCSNPITLGYINHDIITHFKVSDNQNVLSFDGKILKNIGIDLDSFACNITATIHIKNNLGEKYFTNINLDIPLKAQDGGIYNGYIAKIIQDDENLYYFFKE